MEAEALTWPQPVIGSDEMPEPRHRRRPEGHFSDDELRDLIGDLVCTLHTREHNIKTTNGKWWVAPSAAVLAVFIAVFGVRYVPQAQSDSDRRVDKLEERVRHTETLEDQLTKMTAKYENIRTLYLIRFGEDPDQTTPETSKRRKP